MSEEIKFVVTKIAEAPKDHKLSLETSEFDHTTGVYSVELDITWCKYKEQVDALQKRIDELDQRIAEYVEWNGILTKTGDDLRAKNDEYARYISDDQLEVKAIEIAEKKSEALWIKAYLALQEHPKLQAKIADLETELDCMHKRFRKPTHGSCCTCQRCGQFYDDCRCSLDDAADEIVELRTKIADLESENKALRLIAGSHSMSELRRNRIMAGDKRFKYPEAPRGEE